eukprot:COSAG02_NODE_6256_length_3698_cov_6.245902_3_plen_346_part_00
MRSIARFEFVLATLMSGVTDIGTINPRRALTSCTHVPSHDTGQKAFCPVSGEKTAVWWHDLDDSVGASPQDHHFTCIHSLSSKNLEACGSHLTCECTELHWGESTRVVLVLTDTPCHGTRYQSGMPDHFPAGDPSGLDPEQIVREMSRNDVHLYFGRIAAETDQMTAILRKAYESTAGRWSKFGAMDATSWASDPSRFVDTIVDLVTRSVSHTVRHHRENQVRPPGRGGQGGDKPDGTDPPRTETAGWRDYAQRLHSHQGHPAQAPKVPLPVDRLRSRALAASAFGNKMRPPGVPQTGPAASVPAELIGRVAPMSQRPPPPPPPSDGGNDGAPAPPPRPVPQTAL